MWTRCCGELGGRYPDVEVEIAVGYRSGFVYQPVNDKHGAGLGGILNIKTDGGYRRHHFAYLPRRVKRVIAKERLETRWPRTFNLYKSVVFPALSYPSCLSPRSALPLRPDPYQAQY